MIPPVGSAAIRGLGIRLSFFWFGRYICGGVGIGRFYTRDLFFGREGEESSGATSFTLHYTQGTSPELWGMLSRQTVEDRFESY